MTPREQIEELEKVGYPTNEEWDAIAEKLKELGKVGICSAIVGRVENEEQEFCDHFIAGNGEECMLSLAHQVAAFLGCFPEQDPNDVLEDFIDELKEAISQDYKLAGGKIIVAKTLH